MAIGEMFNPLFDPLLKLGAFWALLLTAAVLSLTITLIYKWMTNQEEMKSLKQKTKDFQKQMKEHKDNPKKLMAIQKEAMSINSKYMMKSMKPTLVTFLPIIIIFGWLGANLAYAPIHVDDSFSLELHFKDATIQNLTLIVPDGLELVGEPTKAITNNIVKWDLKAKEIGIYELGFTYGGKQYNQPIKVTDAKLGDYATVDQKISDGSSLKLIKTILTPIKPMGEFSLFGWHPNWLWTYIIFSMIFSLGLRKAMGLY